MSALDAPLPSKRTKSTSARDLRYGRRGGRWLPMMTDYEQAEAFAGALDRGEVVYAECLCLRWWLAACDVGARCGEPMRAVAA